MVIAKEIMTTDVITVDPETSVKEAANIIKDYKYLICFNGINFDLKFINHRASLHKINLSLENKCIIDLLKIYRNNKNHLDIDNFKLKTIEKYININIKREI